MNKIALLDEVIATVEKDLAFLQKAAEQTHKESTSDESKQEGKYDTRGLEASYLAGAQAMQLTGLTDGLRNLKTLRVTLEDETEEPDSVRMGTIVILSGEKDFNYFLLPAGGGFSLEMDGEPLMVVTPDSPIGEIILGKGIADSMESPQLGEVFVSEIY